MRETYHALNDAVFYGTMPPCRFYVATFQGDEQEFYGHKWKCADGVLRITLNLRHRWTAKLVVAVMSHEMIHVYAETQKSERTKNELHGRFFQYHHRRIFGIAYNQRTGINYG